MEATNRAASSLILLLSDGFTAAYMSIPDAVPLLTKVLEKSGMEHPKEIAYVHYNMASWVRFGDQAPSGRLPDL